MTSLIMFFLLLIVLCGGKSYSGQAQGHPIIHIDQTEHTFGMVFEGEELSHTFTVFNKGTGNLNIEKVTHA
jgi:hypothetical protein